MFIYDNLNDRELDNLRKAYFGNVLLSIKEIGREAIIEELRKRDALIEMRKKYPYFVVAITKKKEKEFKEIERYVLWKTRNIQNYMSLNDFMNIKRRSRS